MYIDRLYNALNVLLNKDQKGKITIADYNSLLGHAQAKVVSGILPSLEKSKYRQLRMQSASNLGDKSFHFEQYLEYYTTEEEVNITGGKATLSPDVMYINSVFDEETGYEKQSLKTFNMLMRSSRMKPNVCLPIYTYNDKILKISTDKTKVDVNYIRKPRTPKYTFTIAMGREMFNPSASDFQDIDLPEGLFPELLTEVLAMAGLNLREQEVEAFAERLKQESIYNKQ